MKKLVIVIAIIMALMICFVGCSNDKTTTKQGDEPKQVENKSEPSGSDTKAEAPKENEQKEEAQESTSVDKSLSGLELLKNFKYKAPKSLFVETEMKMGEMVTKISTYYKGASSRVETDTPYGIKSILIHSEKEKATYHYNEGEKTGMVMPDGETMDMFEMDMSAPTFSDITDAAGEDIVARVEMLDGEEVVYIETMDEDEGVEAKIMMWFSTKYMIPMKLEINSGGNVVLSQEVTNIEANGNIDDSLFVPPTDVEFTNFSMDDMFGGED